MALTPARRPFLFLFFLFFFLTAVSSRTGLDPQWSAVSGLQAGKKSPSPVAKNFVDASSSMSVGRRTSFLSTFWTSLSSSTSSLEMWLDAPLYRKEVTFLQPVDSLLFVEFIKKTFFSLSRYTNRIS